MSQNSNGKTGGNGGQRRPNTNARKTSGTSAKNKSRKKSNKKHTALSVFISVVLVCFLTVCIVSGYVLANAFLVVNDDEPSINLEDTKTNQDQTSIIYAYDSAGAAVEYIRLHGEINRIWVDLAEMPNNLQDAFVALEDKRFFSHKGVDWYRLAGVVTSLSFDQGASTITQQLIKNITGENEVTIVRKYNEILSALNLEKNYDKDQILEAYLNTVYLGSGCYGVKTAAETYFGKEVEDLTLTECVVLASITKAPYSYNPLYNPDNNQTRREFCLKEMKDQGFISEDEYQQALDYDLILTNDSRYVSTDDDSGDDKEKEEEVYQSFYVDYVIDTVINDLREQLGYTSSEARKMIYYGGLRIYSAVDVGIQETLEKVYSTRSAFPEKNPTNTKEKPAVQSSMTIMDYAGRVVAIVGQAGEKDGNRCLNRAANSPRQPGSSIKPLSVYGPGINENVLTWSTMVQNNAMAFNGKLWPKNVDGTTGSGKNVTVQYALQVSLNTVPARIVSGLLPNGIMTSLKYLSERFHLSHVDMKNDNSLPPVAVGAMTNGATTLEMASAYAAFGNGGYYYKPYCYYEVFDNQGELLLSTKISNKEGEQILDTDTADVMCELLQTVPTSSYGSGYRVQKFPIMCKTGTTDDEKDRWFCAGTPYYVCSIWYGYDQPKAMNYSLNPCGKIFLDVFSKIHSNLEIKDFEKSGKTVHKAYCAESGKLAGDNCKVGGYGWYKTTNIPSVCTTCTGSSAVDDVVDGIIDAGSILFPGLHEFIYGTTTTTTTAPADDAEPDDAADNEADAGDIPDEAER